MNPHYPLVAKRAGHRCEYCRAPEGVFNLAFEVEHIIPLARDGGGDETNLALSCRACNLFKADHLTGLDEISRAEVSLFHPRQDSWEEYFQVEPGTGVIRGLTEIGRATVQRLRMNQPVSLSARLQWMSFGLFP